MKVEKAIAINKLTFGTARGDYSLDPRLLADLHIKGQLTPITVDKDFNIIDGTRRAIHLKHLWGDSHEVICDIT